MSADAAQLALFPLFIGGALNPLNDVLDVAVGVTLSALVGFHWSFAPAFIGKFVPFLNAVPTWTGSMWLATPRPGRRKEAPAVAFRAASPNRAKCYFFRRSGFHKSLN